METKLKVILKKRNISQRNLHDLIDERYKTPVGQYALSEIVNGKKLNYHLITLVKICTVLKIKPHSLVETDTLNETLYKREYSETHL